jgi:hypothetical protein
MGSFSSLLFLEDWHWTTNLDEISLEFPSKLCVLKFSARINIIYRVPVTAFCRKRTKIISFQQQPETAQKQTFFRVQKKTFPTLALSVYFERCVFNSSLTLRASKMIICMPSMGVFICHTQLGTRFVIISVVKLHLLSAFVHESTCDVPTKHVYDLSYRVLPHDTHKFPTPAPPVEREGPRPDVHTVGFHEGNQSR